MENHNSSLENRTSQFKSAQKHLYVLEREDFFKNIRFLKSIRFRPSMTFLQNSSYKKAHYYYQQILNARGVELSSFEVFETISKYEGRELPIVYELWCLVSIIKGLQEYFHFRIKRASLEEFLKQIKPNQRVPDQYVKIEFDGILNNRRAILHYQKKLSNGKRPDFIVEIICGAKTRRLILDAKFKNYTNQGALEKESLLMEEKYGEGMYDAVFVLHPSSLQKPYLDTNLGGYPFTRAKSVLPNHQFGYILLRPNDTKNLQTLLGLGLEYLVESSLSTDDKDPKPEEDIFCLNCNSVNFDCVLREYRSGGFHYEYTCQDCSHFLDVNYCWNCQTKLYKHGGYWDYHRTSVWDQFDIHCPKCGLTLSDMG